MICVNKRRLQNLIGVPGFPIPIKLSVKLIWWVKELSFVGMLVGIFSKISLLQHVSALFLLISSVYFAFGFLFPDRRGFSKQDHFSANCEGGSHLLIAIIAIVFIFRP